MRGYYGMDRSTSACVRFVRNAELYGDAHEVFAEVRSLGFRCVYVDLRVSQAGDVLANQMAHALQLAHAPYTHKHWVCFLDDLMSLFADGAQQRGLFLVRGWRLSGLPLMQKPRSCLTAPRLRLLSRNSYGVVPATIGFRNGSSTATSPSQSRSFHVRPALLAVA